MYSYGPPHMAVQKQDDQHKHTFSSYVRIRDVVLKTYLRRWTIGRSGERGSGISVLPARHNDDNDDQPTGQLIFFLFLFFSFSVSFLSFLFFILSFFFFSCFISHFLLFSTFLSFNFWIFFFFFFYISFFSVHSFYLLFFLNFSFFLVLLSFFLFTFFIYLFSFIFSFMAQYYWLWNRIKMKAGWKLTTLCLILPVLWWANMDTSWSWLTWGSATWNSESWVFILLWFYFIIECL